MGGRGAPALPHTIPLDDFHRHRGEPRHGTVAAPAARPTREHRDAARVRTGLRRRLDTSEEAARPRPSFPDAVGPGRPDPGRGLLPGADGDTAGRHLDPPDRMAAHRFRHLLRV